MFLTVANSCTYMVWVQVRVESIHFSSIQDNKRLSWLYLFNKLSIFKGLFRVSVFLCVRIIIDNYNFDKSFKHLIHHFLECRQVTKHAHIWRAPNLYNIWSWTLLFSENIKYKLSKPDWDNVKISMQVLSLTTCLPFSPSLVWGQIYI